MAYKMYINFINKRIYKVPTICKSDYKLNLSIDFRKEKFIFYYYNLTTFFN